MQHKNAITNLEKQNMLNVQTEGCRLLLSAEIEINLKGLFMQMFKAVDQ